MPTLISYEQLSKTWKVVAGGAVSLLAIGGVVVLMQGKNAAGIVTYKDFSDGSREQSGSLLIHSGSTTIHANASTNRLGVGMRNPKTRLEVLGTASGTDIYASRNVSGASLYARNAITGSHLYVSGTFGGAGMVDCDADNQTLNWDASTKQFVCGDDDSGGGTGGSSPEVGTSSFSGATLRLSDARYVQKQGDTMTGSLNVRATLSGQTLVITGNGSFTGKLVVAKSISGAALEVLGTASGQNVYATSSVTGSHLYAVTTFAGAGLASCSNATTSKLLYNAATKQFSCGTDTDTDINTTYTPGQGLTLTNTSFRLSARHSGSTIQASDTLASSGSLVWEGTASGLLLIVSGNGSFSGSLVVAKNISGAALEVLGTASGLNLYATQSVTGTHLYAATTFAGAGLASCSNGTTSKLLYNSATKQFSCGTDTAPTYTAGQGLTITNSSFSLSARHSGSIILASTTLASSGTIIAEGSMSGQNLFSAISVTGTHLYAVRTLNGAGLGDCDTAGTSKLLWSVETKRFSCGTDGNTAYTAGNLLTLVGTQFRVKSILTGTTLRASSMLASSGAITWEGLGSGNNLYISGTLSASGRIVTDGTMSGFVVRYGSISPQVKQAMIYASGSTIAVGSGRYLYVVPRTMSGYKLGEVHVKVQTAGTTNTSTFRFRNVTKNNRHLLTVPVSIDSGELGSDTAATAYTIAPNPDVGAYDTLSFDIASVSTTAPKGLMFTFTFYKP